MAFFSQDQMEIEVAIESARIRTVLDSTLDRMGLALRLPDLVANDLALLRPFLREEDLEVVKGIARKLPAKKPHDAKSQTGKKSSRLTLASGDSNSQMGGKVERQDPEVCRAIHLLCSKPKLLKKIVRQVELNENASNFMTLLRQLRECVELRLRTGAAEERAREQALSLAWRRNEQAKLDIAVLKEKLRDTKHSTAADLTSRNQVMSGLKTNINRLVQGCNEDCAKMVSDSECRMVTACKNFEHRRESLSQDVRQNTTKLNSLLSEHLLNEKDLRAKKYKVESQLASWLEKYDLDIGEKQAEWEEIEDGFNKEKEQMALLKEEFDTQEEEYEVLMAEKEEEYQKELEEKMYIFLFNRSARRIQRFWRAYRERKLARKKARRARALARQMGKKK